MKDKRLHPSKEICLCCGHIEKWHIKGGCVQPTCICSGFEHSNIFYGFSNMECYYKGQEDMRKSIIKRIKKIDIEEFFGDYCFKANSLLKNIIKEIKLTPSNPK